jgi:hypothetical protein
LKLIDTDRTSRSYTEMISTLPWQHKVMAFRQGTTLSGSYDALRSSVCSIAERILTDGLREVNRRWQIKHGGTGA